MLRVLLECAQDLDHRGGPDAQALAACLRKAYYADDPALAAEQGIHALEERGTPVCLTLANRLRQALALLRARRAADGLHLRLRRPLPPTRPGAVAQLLGDLHQYLTALAAAPHLSTDERAVLRRAAFEIAHLTEPAGEPGPKDPR